MNVNNSSISLPLLGISYKNYITNQIFSYIMVSMCIVGTPLNVLSLIIILSSKLKNITIFRYLAIVSTSDLLVLLSSIVVDVGNILVTVLTEKQFQIIYCQFFTFTATFGMQLSSLHLIAVTIDRYLCVTFPAKAKIWSTIKMANRIIVILTILIFLLNITIIIGENNAVRYSKYTIVCSTTTAFGRFLYKSYYLVIGVIYSYIPSVLLIILNFLIIKNLRAEKILFKNNHLDNKNQDKKEKTKKRLTIMNIGISVTFIICSVPVVSQNVFLRFAPPNYLGSNTQILVYRLTNFLGLSNHMVNFFFYFFGGSSFRIRFYQLFNKTKKNNDNNNSSFCTNSY